MRIIYFILTFIAFQNLLSAQSLSVKVSSDSILLGNYIDLVFTIKDLDGEFSIPNLEEFDLISGPNISRSYRFVNGETSSHITYSYLIKPTQTGTLFIGSARVTGGGHDLETQPVKLNVYPNPEGIIINPPTDEENTHWFSVPKNPPDSILPEKRSGRKLKRI